MSRASGIAQDRHRRRGLSEIFRIFLHDKHSPQSATIYPGVRRAFQRRPKPETNPVTDYKTQIDQRPFRSKADQQREVALQTQYHNLAIPAVVAALQVAARPAVAGKTDKQMG
jgi:hypothetical protein